jgi:hypothetical protein
MDDTVLTRTIKKKFPKKKISNFFFLIFFSYFPNSMNILPNFDETKHCKIPLLNKKKVIRGYAIVDIQDYEHLSKISWCLGNQGYVMGHIKLGTIRIATNMHRYLLKASKLSLIDHKNLLRYDNRKLNLRFATASQNAQNRAQCKRSNSKSKFTGVHFITEGKWKAMYSKLHLGTFNSAEAAAYIYDTYVLNYIGNESKINNVQKPTDFKRFLKKPVEHVVINGQKLTGLTIRRRPNKSVQYTIFIKYKNIFKNTISTSLEKALVIYIHWKEKVKALKLQELQDIQNAPIIRNEIGIAILKCYNGATQEYIDVQVDDDIYKHYISKVCFLEGKYPTISNKGSALFLHRLVMDALPNSLIDHRDRNPLNALRSNLRDTSPSVNAHNTTKAENCSSKYVGVSFENNKYRIYVEKNGTKYRGGSYKSEKVAAWARNKLAIEVYGEDASLNDVVLEDYVWKYNRAYSKSELEIVENFIAASKRLQEIKAQKTKKTSKYIGVSKKHLTFVASVRHQKTTICAGRYKDEQVAAWARDQLILQLHNGIIPNNIKLNNIQLENYNWKDNRAILKQPKRKLEDAKMDEINKEPRIL